MVKLKDMMDVRIVTLVSALILEEISKKWLKDILEMKKFSASHFCREWSEPDFFVDCIWDNLSEEQKNKVIESLNMLIEEDILIDKQPFGNYCFKLLQLALILSRKRPGEINTKPFKLWKEKDYYNLSQPVDHAHFVIKNLDIEIEHLIKINQSKQIDM